LHSFPGLRRWVFLEEYFMKFDLAELIVAFGLLALGLGLFAITLWLSVRI